MGRILGPELVETTQAMDASLHQRLPRPTMQVRPDIAYGSDARQRLDVHLPNQPAARGAATVIFFHGGGFIDGEKNIGAGYAHGNIASSFAQHGIIGINATYRLAPAALWPAGAEDVGAALAWARTHVAEFGGDPDKVFLMGQSAGAAHVATYAFRKQLHPAAGPGLAGAILMSGPYAVETGKLSPNAAAYFGTDASRHPGMQVLGNIERADFPVHVGVAEFDPPQFERSALELMLELFRHTGRAPRVRQYLGHNHVSPAYSFGTDDLTVAPDILDFVRGGGHP